MLLSRAERLELKCAEMREQQRLQREAAAQKRASEREAKRSAKETGAVVAKAEIVGFTWGKPIPRRTKAQMRSAWRASRKKKLGPVIPAPRTPRCQCGTCPECTRRKKHTEYVRNQRARRATENTE